MIVVTGGIACGKSTFVEVAREMAFNVVETEVNGMTGTFSVPITDESKW